MAKIKIHELAKEFGVQSKEVIAFLQSKGIEAKAAQSAVVERPSPQQRKKKAGQRSRQPKQRKAPNRQKRKKQSKQIQRKQVNPWKTKKP